MTTFSVVILPAKRLANGKHRIRIAVAHHSQTRYITTPFLLDSSSQLKKGKVVRHVHADKINHVLHRQMDEYALILSTLPYADGLTCTEIIHYIRQAKEKEGLTFFRFAGEFLKEMENKEQVKSYKLYKSALRHFFSLFGKSLFLQQLGPLHIRQYREELEKKKLSDTTVRIYLTLVKVMVNHAIKMGYAHYAVHPFAACKLPAARIRELDLTIEELKRIRDVQLTDRRLVGVRDIFMLSYYLGGINLRDLLNCRFTEGCTVLRYARHKTRKSKTGENETAFTIQPEARRLIARYRSPGGLLVFEGSTIYNKVYSLVYRYMGKVARLAGISSKVSYYSARKSFVQHGYDLGIQIETIEYCIGHSMKTNRPICNYFRIMQRHADAAMRRIFDSLL